MNAYLMNIITRQMEKNGTRGGRYSGSKNAKNATQQQQTPYNDSSNNNNSEFSPQFSAGNANQYAAPFQ
eukprot:CAMPEP_0197048110 /NCGR_PEP_ID=MMETSP1384-20130603/23510_1 /TAXON_ID=29189 /ORGANISM="Ammonia sp." /LENGTH=68 /DNA_ID=CAMNT_0042480175 /DNA_START=5 /DNA_END=208 /DNA_ORIENTATION=-